MSRARRAGAGAAAGKREVQRVQTGVKLEKRMLLVLKALAGSLDVTLGDLLEGIVLHAFEGKAPFEPATLKKIRQLKQTFELDLTAADAHRLGDRAS